MANKRRPKKTKAPYRKYVAGQGFVHTRGFTSTSTDDNITEDFTDLSLEDNHEASIEIGLPISSENLELNINDYTETKLPLEIFDLILSMIKEEYLTSKLLLVCKAWYIMCLPRLYHTPRLNSKNFSRFVDMVLTDRKRKSCDHVVRLDLSTIIQSGKNSNVSKILRRCSKNLISFTAPQTSFGIAPLISLKSCEHLRYLDLGLVSETVNLKDLFLAIQNFHHLTHLSFPRSSVECEGYQDFTWPPNLQYLKLSGGISNEFVQETNFPRTIKTLEFSFCPKITEHSIYVVLARIGDNLSQLYFYYPMPALKDNSLDYVFRYCPNLTVLQLMVDYCSKWIFSEYFFTQIDYPRPLKTLILDCSGHLGQASKIHPDDLTIAIFEGRLPCLKTVRVSSRLGWDSHNDDVDDLVSCFEDHNEGSIYITY